MQHSLKLVSMLLVAVAFTTCKKRSQGSSVDCDPAAAMVRQISDKPAVVKVTGTVTANYLVEEGSIDNKLVPCNLPIEFLQNNLQVIVSGTVRARTGSYSEPCCTQSLMITKIVKR